MCRPVLGKAASFFLLLLILILIFFPCAGLLAGS
jgi:hypothetical protein